MGRTLRQGYTTGACAAAAALAAAQTLEGGEAPERVTLDLPAGQRASFSVLWARRTPAGAVAAIRKDAGDDPDVTDGVLVVVHLEPRDQGDLEFQAGEGVGTVTRPGLQVPVGEPAINPVPRRMIRDAIRSVSARPLRVTVAIPGGEALAQRTFNPRLGVVGGLSVLGTTGVVRPFSHQAIRDTIGCALDVARACGVEAPVLVPGRVGERAARRHFRLGPEQVVEVSNEWGFALDQAGQAGFATLLALGHPGKLAKLAAGAFDTHSRSSAPAGPFVREVARSATGSDPGAPNTVEGLFRGLAAPDRGRVARALAGQVRERLEARTGGTVAVALVDMAGELLGTSGDLGPWDPTGS